MCGIVGVWNRERKFPQEVYDNLFKHAEKRGVDGTGCSMTIMDHILTWKRTEKYSDIKNNILKNIDFYNFNLLLFITRAQPETEVNTSKRNMQPISKEGIILIHNGAVSNRSVTQYSDLGYTTEIDSEAIINAYIENGKDMKKTMESLIGGFSFILYDSHQERLYIVNDFKPLAIGYWKGHGLIIHSSLDALEEINEVITGTNRTGINTWEDFYFHWHEGYTIREIDLDSGMQRIYNFTPNFYHPTWNKNVNNGKELALVSASGGIDSGLTSYILKLCGYDVKMIHFNYGQRGEETERLGVEYLSKELDIPYNIIDIDGYFKSMEKTSMLLDKNSEITSGTENDIKSTVAWVPCRNLIFMSMLSGLAESEIIQNNWKKVYIASGMAQLEESGFYPDNSEYFMESFMNTLMYSSITSNRIEHIPVLRNVMKYEEWILGNKINFPFHLTVSCDNPKVENGEIYLCRECGSTRLSIFASQMAGIEDNRKFYGSERDDLIPYKSGEVRRSTPEEIIDRLIIKEEDKEKLKEVIKE